MFVFIQISTLAFSNLLIFSLLEMASDKLDNHASLALVMGEKRTKLTIYVVLLLGLFFSLLLFIITDEPVLQSAQNIMMLMNLVLISIISSGYFLKNERFRYIGDGIFFLPLLHLLWL